MSNYYRPAGFGFSFFPPVIKNLLIINGVVFLLQVVGQNIGVGDGYTFYDIIMKYFALMPLDGYEAGRRGLEIITWNFYPWQLITYQFMHGGFAHIFFNMFSLWMFGMEIENLWGSKKFLYYYLLCGISAGIFHLALSPLLTGGTGPTIGASGAIFGVLVAFGMIFPNRYIFLYFLVPVKAKYLIAFFILIEIFAINSTAPTVAHLAHLGGALAGFIFIMFDPHTDAEIKYLFKKSSYGRTPKPFNPFDGLKNRFKKKEEPEEAKFYDIKEEDEGISQEEIDKILDKISQSGYQNLTEKEKRILFEASKKIK
ncbi:MAG TPA: rhomboid family intramembrane serine protease [Ignavibacteriaceae bacterium]|nr:rhomboid family intramembrane serine protease [Ignavibacteriaceae bacterium]